MSAGVYQVPEEHREFVEGIRQVVQGKVAPRAAEIDRTSEYPWDVRRLFAEADILALPFASGTRTSSNEGEPVGDPRMPSLCSRGPGSKPGMSFSTTNALIRPDERSVFANTT